MKEFEDFPDKFPGLKETSLDGLNDLNLLKTTLMKTVEYVLNLKGVDTRFPPGSWYRHIVCQRLYLQVKEDDEKLKIQMDHYAKHGTGLILEDEQ